MKEKKHIDLFFRDDKTIELVVKLTDNFGEMIEIHRETLSHKEGPEEIEDAILEAIDHQRSRFDGVDRVHIVRSAVIEYNYSSLSTKIYRRTWATVSIL
ncbi:hypothetical protein [Porphyromonas gulae]|uniref:Uncharacterized protein n=1 Tax=Porphyromonas gulae TaxID=111105 RepID=A0A0A2F4S4_9PORP|nr:hypothetical protein [Porphyromonas gulae]KGN85055.1 hypothetical protein HR08_07045 [Porphyromonas gulae]